MDALASRYRQQVVPRLLNWALGTRVTVEIRREVCAGLAGEVVEIGFGSGLNVPYYPPAVTAVAAVEPAAVGWQLAEKRVAASPVPVHHAGLDGQRLPFADESFHAALSTWALCSIPDASAALAELRRVLRPGGRYHFLEHGRAPDARVQRMQRRMKPLHSAAFGGCDFTKPVLTLISEAGFDVENATSFYQRGAPKYVGANVLGVAVNR